MKYGTDKWGGHKYTPHYDSFFSKYRNEPIRFLEIGVGGGRHRDQGGASLRMWKEYFPRAQIVSIDIFDKSTQEEERIKIYQGDQSDEAFLEKVVAEAGPFDIIIDDGSHRNNHIIKSFEILFPKLKDDGIYAVEDLQSTYWPKKGGDSFNLNNKKTAMNFFKRLVDRLNYEEIDNPYYKPTYLDKHIVAMSFFHNMVFVQKGENDEGSNMVTQNRLKTRKPVKSAIFYFLRRIKQLLLFN